MQCLFNSLQHLPLFARVAIALAGSRSSWVFHLSQTLYFSARPCCPPKEVIGIPDCPTLPLSGWSFGVWLRHRWSIVGVLTKITPSHSWLTTPLPTSPLLLPRLPHGKVDLILQNPPSGRWDAWHWWWNIDTHTRKAVCFGTVHKLETDTQHSSIYSIC